MHQIFSLPWELERCALSLVNKLVKEELVDCLDSVSIYGWTEDDFLRKQNIESFVGSSKACFWHPSLGDWVIKVGFRDLSEDYAEVEYKTYLKAQEHGLERYFPMTYFLGEFEETKFYLQQRAECVPEEVHSKLIGKVSEIGRYESYTLAWDAADSLEDDVRAMLLFDDEALVDFLLENCVNDLHEGNFGYIDGKLVIIDFSGWRD
jgi:hypothetical protein